MKKTCTFLTLFLIISCQFINAQELTDSKAPILRSKFQLGVGVYFPTQKVKFSVAGNSDNQIIEFDKTFDFNDNQVTPQVFFDWRFAKKWKLYAEYFNVNYGSNKELENDIIAGDYTFEAGSNVKVGYKLNMYRLFVGTLFYSNPKQELGGGLGFHILNIGPFIQGNIIVNGSDNEFQRVDTSATAPLPNIGIWYFYAPTQKWALTARVDFFGLNLSEYSGDLWDVSPGVNYQIIENLAIGLEYRFFDVNLHVKEDYWHGNADLSFSGVTLKIVGSL